MRIHFVMHESFEAPGAFEVWAKKKGHEITYTRLYDGDTFPETVDGFDYLIVMGGPQSPATTLEECAHFDTKAEQSFIKKAIDAGKYVAGACLGAQMIGEALGAEFGHSPNREIGVFDLTLTNEAKDDPIFKDFPTVFPVGHWHGDMPGLTEDAVLLGKSGGCPRQIVRYTPKVYGFQCHFEFNSETINGMIENCGHELEEAATSKYIETAEELRAHNYGPMNELLFKFLNHMEVMFNESTR